MKYRDINLEKLQQTSDTWRFPKIGVPGYLSSPAQHHQVTKKPTARLRPSAITAKAKTAWAAVGFCESETWNVTHRSQSYGYAEFRWMDRWIDR